MNILERASQLAHGAKTLAEWLGDGYETVRLDVAQDRADICLGCPFNRHIGTIAQAVAVEIKKQVELKNHLNMKIDGEKSLKTCHACGCALRLKIWIPKKRLLLAENEKSLLKYHQDCWLRDPNPV